MDTRLRGYDGWREVVAGSSPCGSPVLWAKGCGCFIARRSGLLQVECARYLAQCPLVIAPYDSNDYRHPGVCRDPENHPCSGKARNYFIPHPVGKRDTLLRGMTDGERLWLVHCPVGAQSPGRRVAAVSSPAGAGSYRGGQPWGYAF